MSPYVITKNSNKKIQTRKYNFIFSLIFININYFIERANNGINTDKVTDSLSVLPLHRKNYLVITERNNPKEILNVELLTCFMRSIIKAKIRPLKIKIGYK